MPPHVIGVATLPCEI